MTIEEIRHRNKMFNRLFRARKTYNPREIWFLWLEEVKKTRGIKQSERYRFGMKHSKFFSHWYDTGEMLPASDNEEKQRNDSFAAFLRGFEEL